MLDKLTLASALIKLFNDMEQQAEAGNPLSKEQFAEELANTIDSYVRLAQVVVADNVGVLQ